MLHKLISDRISHQISWVNKEVPREGLVYGELSEVNLKGNKITLKVTDVKIGIGYWTHLEDQVFIVENILPEVFLSSNGELFFSSDDGKVAFALYPYPHSRHVWR